MRNKMVLFMILLSFNAGADELKYFGSKIDYWNDSQQKPLPVPSEPSKNGANKFPWTTYLDPKNREFFKEGDYTPPEPFMEIARNPTDENIKNWFDFMKKKNELARRLDERVREYIAKNGQVQVSRERSLATFQMPPPPVKGPLDAKRFKILMYFRPSCPHCQRMFGVLKRLHDQGVEVSALQVDQDPVPEPERIVPLGKARPEDLKKDGVNGVPFLVIADKIKKVRLPPIEGYHDYGEIVDLLQSVSR